MAVPNSRNEQDALSDLMNHPVDNNRLSDFPFGAVYFRKSNPPEEDWERDYSTASKDGMNAFRHWVPWSAVEISPGEWDWKDYDRQLDLAHKHGIKTILSEMLVAAPEWAFDMYSHAKYETRDGQKLESQISGSCVVGGFPGLCLDNDEILERAKIYLSELAGRYKDHPAMGGYDIWNECNFDSRTCFCPSTTEKFKIWLINKYKNLKDLNLAWNRYSFTKWEQIKPPRSLGPYPQVMDWLQFRIDRAYELFKWRIQVIRAIDNIHPITAHGIAGSFRQLASQGADDWKAANEVDIYGFTWGSSRHGDEPWKQFHAVDLVRAASRGKYFWHAEAYAGPLWMQPQVVGKPRTEGRIAYPEDIRYWHLISMMCGVKGSFYLRWRPLLNGPLFGAFGPYANDGTRTDRSKMSSQVAKWISSPENDIIRQSTPIKGEVGILVLPETQIFTYAQQEDPGFYTRSMEGVYQGFFDANIQADWILIDHIDEYNFIYLPYPIMMLSNHAEKIINWVNAGGILVSEGCPGYWGDNYKIGTQQPNMNFNHLFGVQESYVEFTPDLQSDLKIMVDGTPVWGAFSQQAYQPVSAIPVGWFEDGRIAACDHIYGKGRTRLIGTMCGAGYASHPANRSPFFFHELLRFAGIHQHITSSNPKIKARFQESALGTTLWIANPLRQTLPVRLRFSSQWGSFSSGKILWGEAVKDLFITGRTVALTVPSRDVVVIQLSLESDNESQVKEK